MFSQVSVCSTWRVCVCVCGGGMIPISIPKTSTGPMSFLGLGVPVTCPRSLLGGGGGGNPVPGWGVPQSRGGGDPRTGVPPWSGQDWSTPTSRTGLGYQLCRGRYASCGFQQEDCLVIYSIININP